MCESTKRGYQTPPHTQSLATIEQVPGNLEQPARVGHQRVEPWQDQHRVVLLLRRQTQSSCGHLAVTPNAQPQRIHILHRGPRYHRCRGRPAFRRFRVGRVTGGLKLDQGHGLLLSTLPDWAGVPSSPSSKRPPASALVSFLYPARDRERGSAGHASTPSMGSTILPYAAPYSPKHGHMRPFSGSGTYRTSTLRLSSNILSPSPSSTSSLSGSYIRHIL